MHPPHNCAFYTDTIGNAYADFGFNLTVSGSVTSVQSVSISRGSYCCLAPGLWDGCSCDTDDPWHDAECIHKVAVSYCDSEPCLNGGVCSEVQGQLYSTDYNCACVNGFSGDNCQLVGADSSGRQFYRDFELNGNYTEENLDETQSRAAWIQAFNEFWVQENIDVVATNVTEGSSDNIIVTLFGTQEALDAAAAVLQSESNASGFSLFAAPVTSNDDSDSFDELANRLAIFGCVLLLVLCLLMVCCISKYTQGKGVTEQGDRRIHGKNESFLADDLKSVNGWSKTPWRAGAPRSQSEQLLKDINLQDVSIRSPITLGYADLDAGGPKDAAYDLKESTFLKGRGNAGIESHEVGTTPESGIKQSSFLQDSLISESSFLKKRSPRDIKLVDAETDKNRSIHAFKEQEQDEQIMEEVFNELELEELEKRDIDSYGYTTDEDIPMYIPKDHQDSESEPDYDNNTSKKSTLQRDQTAGNDFETTGEYAEIFGSSMMAGVQEHSDIDPEEAFDPGLVQEGSVSSLPNEGRIESFSSLPDEQDEMRSRHPRLITTSPSSKSSDHAKRLPMATSLREQVETIRSLHDFMSTTEFDAVLSELLVLLVEGLGRHVKPSELKSVSPDGEISPRIRFLTNSQDSDRAEFSDLFWFEFGPKLETEELRDISRMLEEIVRMRQDNDNIWSPREYVEMPPGFGEDLFSFNADYEEIIPTREARRQFGRELEDHVQSKYPALQLVDVYAGSINTIWRGPLKDLIACREWLDAFGFEFSGWGKIYFHDEMRPEDHFESSVNTINTENDRFEIALAGMAARGLIPQKDEEGVIAREEEISYMTAPIENYDDPSDILPVQSSRPTPATSKDLHSNIMHKPHDIGDPMQLRKDGIAMNDYAPAMEMKQARLENEIKNFGSVVAESDNESPMQKMESPLPRSRGPSMAESVDPMQGRTDNLIGTFLDDVSSEAYEVESNSNEPVVDYSNPQIAAAAVAAGIIAAPKSVTPPKSATTVIRPQSRTSPETAPAASPFDLGSPKYTSGMGIEEVPPNYVPPASAPDLAPVPISKSPSKSRSDLMAKYDLAFNSPKYDVLLADSSTTPQNPVIKKSTFVSSNQPTKALTVAPLPQKARSKTPSYGNQLTNTHLNAFMPTPSRSVTPNPPEREASQDEFVVPLAKRSTTPVKTAPIAAPVSKDVKSTMSKAPSRSYPAPRENFEDGVFNVADEPMLVPEISQTQGRDSVPFEADPAESRSSLSEAQSPLVLMSEIDPTPDPDNVPHQTHERQRSRAELVVPKTNSPYRPMRPSRTPSPYHNTPTHTHTNQTSDVTPQAKTLNSDPVKADKGMMKIQSEQRYPRYPRNAPTPVNTPDVRDQTNISSRAFVPSTTSAKSKDLDSTITPQAPQLMPTNQTTQRSYAETYRANKERTEFDSALEALLYTLARDLGGKVTPSELKKASPTGQINPRIKFLEQPGEYSELMNSEFGPKLEVMELRNITMMLKRIAKIRKNNPAAANKEPIVEKASPIRLVKKTNRETSSNPQMSYPIMAKPEKPKRSLNPYGVDPPAQLESKVYRSPRKNEPGAAKTEKLSVIRDSHARSRTPYQASRSRSPLPPRYAPAVPQKREEIVEGKPSEKKKQPEVNFNMTRHVLESMKGTSDTEGGYGYSTGLFDKGTEVMVLLDDQPGWHKGVVVYRSKNRYNIRIGEKHYIRTGAQVRDMGLHKGKAKPVTIAKFDRKASVLTEGEIIFLCEVFREVSGYNKKIQLKEAYKWMELVTKNISRDQIERYAAERLEQSGERRAMTEDGFLQFYADLKQYLEFKFMNELENMRAQMKGGRRGSGYYIGEAEAT